MKGTRRAATRAMLRMPPTITAPTPAAIASPTSQPLSANQLVWPPVTSTSWAKAWFDWNMLPMPRQPTTMPAA